MLIKIKRFEKKIERNDKKWRKKISLLIISLILLKNSTQMRIVMYICHAFSGLRADNNFFFSCENLNIFQQLQKILLLHDYFVLSFLIKDISSQKFFLERCFVFETITINRKLSFFRVLGTIITLGVQQDTRLSRHRNFCGFGIFFFYIANRKFVRFQ